MTENRDIIRLHHMLDAVKEILFFTEGKDIDSLKKDRKTLLAVIKDIEIIGEAASKISNDFMSKYPEILWRAIIDTRNRLIHGYFDVDVEIVWNTVKNSLPDLKVKLEEILKIK